MLRFGIIGVGNIAPVRAEAIQGTLGAELGAVATRDVKCERAFAAQLGATWFGDYPGLSHREDVDIVTICMRQ